METPAATPEMLKEAEVDMEIEIDRSLYDLVSIEAAQAGCSEEAFVEGALRWYLKQIDDPDL